MASLLVGNKNSILSSAFTVSTKKIAISNCTMFDLNASSIQSIYDVTTSLPFDLSQAITCVKTVVAGLPVFTFTFARIPASSADGDTLIINLYVPQEMLTPLLLQVISTATI